MKNKRHHSFTILFIVFMIIMAVSTSQRPPKEINNSISYETQKDYFLIKIRTKLDPNNYSLFDSKYINSVLSLYYENREEQLFFINENSEHITQFNTIEEIPVVHINESGERILSRIEKKIITEQLITDSDGFSTFVENEYFIIKIRNDLLQYGNPRTYGIKLNSKDGKYINEIYIE